MMEKESIFNIEEFFFIRKEKFLNFCQKEIIKFKGSFLDNEDPKDFAEKIYDFFVKEDEKYQIILKNASLIFKRRGFEVGILFLNLFVFLQKEYFEYIKDQNMDFMEEAEKFIVFLENKVKIIESFFIISKEMNEKVSLKEKGRNSSLFDIFKDIWENRESIKLLNFYRGVPIESEAFVLECDEDLIVLRTSRIQEIVMKIGGKVFIQKGDFFPQTVKADVELVNFMNNSVTIKNPRYYFSSRLQKGAKELKVEPKFPLSVKVGKDFAIFNGWILNISLKELTLMSEDLICEKEDEVFIKLSFDEDKKESFKIVGRVEDRYFKNGYYYYFINILNENEKDKIKNFIDKRSKEVVFELEEELKHYIV